MRCTMKWHIIQLLLVNWIVKLVMDSWVLWAYSSYNYWGLLSEIYCIACWLLCRLERLDHLAQKFKHKCSNHEEWASSKEEMLRSLDFKKCRLNELKVSTCSCVINPIKVSTCPCVINPIWLISSFQLVPEAIFSCF